MSEEKTQRLVLSIIDFLNVAIKDGTVKEDDREGLEVAVQCIGEAFGVDPSNKEQSDRLSIKPASLPTIFDLFLKTREKLSGPAAGSSSRSVPTPQPAGPSAADKAEAERHKKEGNVLMSQKSYDAAIESYSRSIELDGQNPVYYSNRAAAYSSKGDHEKAVVDAEAAISADPTFVKAYHRLGYVMILCMSGSSH
ncbi:TPR-like protein [Sistotremastrum niveocremeum HHB9708]|uniref:TPR-like protein n=1 Tax=Sistotremastrum niveocremeum HHB9708 TaxID=1314777 RepID=A0A164XP81_9AGAM|nr:TPR-like protein [Sistotremastrum niveocremeum HHB9708]